MTRASPIGFSIATFFLIGGIVFWVAAPGIGIGQIWVGVAVLLMLVFAAMSRRAAKVEQLRHTGLPGKATILEMTQTGVYINENPQVKMKMQVEAAGIAPYQLEKRVTVPMIALGSLGSGRPLTVHVDPNDHQNIAIDWSPAAPVPVAAQQPAASAEAGAPTGEHEEKSGVERLMELQEMKDKGLISDAEFAESRSRILRDV